MMLSVKLTGFLICLFYAATSTTISMVNKLILSMYNFGGVFILLAFQLLGALLFMGLSKLCTRAGFGSSFLPSIPDFKWSTLQRSLPVSFLFVANVSAAFYGLQLIDVPLFLCVRRLTSLCVLVTEFLVLRKVSSRPVMASILLVMAGTILAGYESLSSYFIGYIYVMMNNILTALLYTWQKKLCDSEKLESFGLLYYNAMAALPASLLIAWALGEFEALQAFPFRYDMGWIGWMAVSSALGIVMTYSTVLCNSYNSPLATAVTGNVKDMISTAIGWALFGGFKVTAMSVSGLSLSFIGAGAFSYIKLMERGAVAPAPASTGPATGTGTPGPGVDKSSPAPKGPATAGGGGGGKGTSVDPAGAKPSGCRASVTPPLDTSGNLSGVATSRPVATQK